MVSMNLNDMVWVHLTKDGWEAHDDFYRGLGLEPSRYRSETHGVDGWQPFQLWSLMEMFGPSIHMGMDPIFVDNEVRLNKPE